MVMPIFIFLMLNIISLFQMIEIHGVLDSALHQVGTELSLYAENDGVYDYSILTEVYVKEKVISIVGRDVIDNSVIKGGCNGITLWRTDLEADKNVLDLIMTYRTSPWFDVFDIGGMTLVNRCYIRAYTGFEIEDGDEIRYYLADTGDVYHLSRSCTHLKLSISEITYQELQQRTNLEGESYSPCEVCCDQQSTSTDVYVTDQGNRYHSTVACTGLKRTIYIVGEKDIGGVPLCSRCNKENN